MFLTSFIILYDSQLEEGQNDGKNNNQRISLHVISYILLM